MERIENTVFLCYHRRDISIAMAVNQKLVQEGYDVFFDYSNIPIGDFEQTILGNIKARAHFLVILTPTTFDRVDEPGDWLRREIETAMDERRNIIPLFYRGFSFGDASVQEKLTGKLANLSRYNGLIVPEQYFDEAMQRLIGLYLKVPLDTRTGPVPGSADRTGKEQQTTANQVAHPIDPEEEEAPEVSSSNPIPIITPENPLLASINFHPSPDRKERRIVPFLPGNDESQTREVTTPWGELSTAGRGDFLVSEAETPENYWPVNDALFEKMFSITRPGAAVLRQDFGLAPLSDLTSGDPNRQITIQSFNGQQTKLAGQGYLARSSAGKIWVVSTGEARYYLGLSGQSPAQAAQETEADRAKREQSAYDRNRLVNNRAQRIYNDRAEGDDQLGIKKEVSALAETLLLREVVPPVAVGVMGGWGSGKSFVMYLIGKHVEETRGKKVKKGWPDNGNEKDPAIPAYVGHIYQIHFNAWTYAKSNLWASLMDTIFLTLNRQMQLERLLAYRKFKADQPSPTAQMVHDSILEGGPEFRKIYVENLQIDQDEDLKPFRQELIYWSQHLLKENMLWNIMRGQQVETLDKLKDTEEQLKQLKARREKFEKDRTLNQMTTETLDATARQAYFQSIKSVLLAFVSDALSETAMEELKKKGVDEKEIKESLDQVNGLAGAFHAILMTFRRNKLLLIWSITFLAITVLLPIFWSRIALDFVRRSTAQAVSILMMSLPVITSVFNWIRKVINFNLEARKVLEGAYVNQQAKDAEAIVNSPDKPLPQKISELQDQFTKGSLAAYDALINLLETQAEEQRQWIGPSAKYANLMDFVQSRLDSAMYENQLGLMHQVRQDIDELTYSLVDSARPEIFPRGKPRVILYIDDLDRCPPARVIEVLEAVQLLLNTKLFIVVLGLDTRYVTRALEKEYKEILQHEGDPSGLDYIEKIIQIPYRVRPIESEALETYLNAQMDIEVIQAQVDAAVGGEDTPAAGASSQGTAGDIKNGQASDSQSGPSTDVPTNAVPSDEAPELPAAVIQFKQEDLLDLTACCQRIDLTPRSLKRLVNVLKLMKIFWFRAGKDDNLELREQKRPVRQAAISLLALSSAYPEVMREAFVHLEKLYRLEQRQVKLLDALNAVKLPPGTAPEITWQLQKYKGDIASLSRISMEGQQKFAYLTLEDFKYSTLNLVRSFSFVGDPVYWTDGEEDISKVNEQSQVKKVSGAKRVKKQSLSS